GPVPSELGNLRALKLLNLSDNKLSDNDLGFRPLTRGPVPSELGNLTDLKLLNLSLNQLSGAVPSPYLGKLSALKRLYLDHNQLSDLGNVQHALQLVSRFDSEGPSYFGGTDLGLRGNPWKMPPEAVVEQGLEAIKIFLGDVLDANKDNDHVRSLQLLKVVLVGSPSAGKTSLMKSIMAGKGSPTQGTSDEASTVGI
ncbi:unnamed protein product, partial [Ascophyllum nodosum]